MISKSRLVIAAASLAASAAAGWWINGALWSDRYAQLERDHAIAIAKSSERARLVEQGWSQAMQKVREDARSETDANDSEHASALNELERLREENALYASRATQNTSAECRSAPATSAILLYSQLLDKCEARNIDYAGEAERRRVAGRACESAYDALLTD